MQEQYKNFAFISYSRKDSKAAAWLQKRLEWFRFPVKLVPIDRRPIQPPYIRPIYRDKTNLEVTNEHYWKNIRQALEESRFLIVLCSPNSAASKPVEMEVAHFMATHNDNLSQVVPVIVAGSVTSRDERAAFGPTLRLHGEALISRNLPTMIDDEIGNQRDAWEQGFVAIASYLLRLDRATIGDHIQRETRRQSRVLRCWLLAVIALALTSLVGGVIAYQQKQAAEKQREEADHQRIEATSQRDVARQGEGRYWLELAKQSITPEGLPTTPEVGMFAGRAIAFQNEHRSGARGDSPLGGNGFPPLLSPSANPAEYQRASDLLNFGLNPTVPVWAAPVSRQHENEIVGILHLKGDPESAISVDSLGHIRVWNLETGDLIREKNEAVKVTCCCTAGKILALGRTDGSVLLLAVDTLKTLRRTIHPLSEALVEISIDTLGERVSGTSEAGEVSVWDTQTSEPILQLTGLGETVNTAAIDPSGKRICYSREGVVTLMEIDGKKQTELPVSDNPSSLGGLSWSPDGQMICACDESNRNFIWDVTSLKLKRTIETPTRTRRNLFNETSDLLVSLPWVYSGGGVSFWKIEDAARVSELPPFHNTSQLSDLMFSSDGRRALAGSYDGKLQWWNVSDGTLSGMIPSGQSDNCVAVAYSPNGKHLANGNSDGTAILYDLRGKGASSVKLQGRHWDSVVIGVAFPFADTEQLLALDSAGDLIVRHRDGRVSYQSLGEKKPLAFASHSTRKIIAIGYTDGSVELRSLDQLEKVISVTNLTPARHPRSANLEDRMGVNFHCWPVSLGFDSDGDKLAVGEDCTYQEKNLRMLSVPELSEIAANDNDQKSVITVAFGLGDSKLVSGGSDGLVRFRDLGKVPEGDKSISIDGSPVTSMAHTTDWRSYAVGTGNGTVRIFNNELKEPVTNIKASKRAINDLSFAPDGNTIAIAAADGTCRIWKVANRKAVGASWSHHLVAVAPSGDNYTTLRECLNPSVRISIIETYDYRTSRLLASEFLPLFSPAVTTSSLDGIIVGLAGTRLRNDNLLPGPTEWDGECVLWNTVLKKEVRRWLPHIRRVDAIAIGGEDYKIATGSYDGLKLWSPDSDAPPLWSWNGLRPDQTGELPGETIESLAFDATGRLLACGLSFGDIVLFDVATGKMISTQKTPRAPDCLKFSPDSKTLFAGTTSGQIFVLPLIEGGFSGFARVLTHEDQVTGLDVDSTGKLLASVTYGGQLRVWSLDREDVMPMYLATAHKNANAVCFRPGYSELLTSGHEFITAWSLSPPIFSGYFSWGESANSPYVKGVSYKDRNLEWISIIDKIGGSLYFQYTNLNGETHLADIAGSDSKPSEEGLFWRFLQLGNWEAALASADLSKDEHLSALVENLSFAKVSINKSRIKQALALPKPVHTSENFSKSLELLQTQFEKLDSK